jgi:hypothetical protein
MKNRLNLDNTRSCYHSAQNAFLVLLAWQLERAARNAQNCSVLGTVWRLVPHGMDAEGGAEAGKLSPRVCMYAQPCNKVLWLSPQIQEGISVFTEGSSTNWRENIY